MMKMKAQVALVLLCLTWRHVTCETTASDEGQSKTDKRALAEGNSGLNKREPQIALSPGIVYADAKETLPDKSPTQQVYATPTPQISKISDVLTGHGPAFPTAITNHLFSPLPVYRPAAKVPTPTYEVSAPIPSQLAYSEHNIIYPASAPAQVNTIQYYPQPQKIYQSQPQRLYQQTSIPRQAILAYPQQIHQQPITYVQEPFLQRQLVQSYQPHQQIVYQPGYLQVQNQNDQTSPQNTRPQTFNHNQYPQNGLIYTQVPVQPAVTYAQTPTAVQVQFGTSQISYTAPGVVAKNLRDFNTQPINVIDKNSDVDNQAIKNEVKSTKSAVSYASFAQSAAGQPSSTYTPAPQPAPIAPKPLHSVNYIPTAVGQPTGPAYVTVSQRIARPVGQPIGLPVRYYTQSNFDLAPQQAFLQQTYQPDHGYFQHGIPAAAPTFPAVQYFGKFAQNLFPGGYKK